MATPIAAISPEDITVTQEGIRINVSQLRADQKINIYNVLHASCAEGNCGVITAERIEFTGPRVIERLRGMNAARLRQFIPFRDHRMVS